MDELLGLADGSTVYRHSEPTLHHCSRSEKWRTDLASSAGKVARPQCPDPRRHACPKRICLVTDSPTPSGVGEHMLTLALGLDMAEKVIVAAKAESGLLERATSLGLAVQPLDPSLPEGFARWTRDEAIELLHVHAGIGWEGHALARDAREAGVPVILRTEHLPFLLTDPEQIAKHREGMGWVDRMICVSQSNADTQRQAGIDGSIIVAIENGVLPTRPSRSAAAVRVDLALGSAPMLLIVGRLTPQKGHELLLDAMPSILERHPDALVVVAGDGPLADELDRKVAACQLGGCIRMLGPRSDVPDLMGAADLLLLPSAFEGLPLVALEAMASGLPIVGTRVTGIVDVVEHGVTGWLSPAGDPPAFAAAVAAALDDELGRRRAAIAACDRFHARFHADRMIAETVAVYEAATRARRSASEDLT